MKNNKNGIEPLKGVFEDSRSAHLEEDVSDSRSGQYYAVATRDEKVKQFDLILRSGEEFSFYYAILPVYVLRANSQITILSYELRINIEGRNLKPLRDALKREKALWIRESPSGKDDATTDVFVVSIEIEGKTAGK